MLFQTPFVHILASYMCVCVCVCVCMYIYIYISISFLCKGNGVSSEDLHLIAWFIQITFCTFSSVKVLVVWTLDLEQHESE